MSHNQSTRRNSTIRRFSAAISQKTTVTPYFNTLSPLFWSIKLHIVRCHMVILDTRAKQHLTKWNKQVKPLQLPVVGTWRGFEISHHTRRSQKKTFQKVLKSYLIFRFTGHCIRKNVVFSIRNCRGMGHGMGQRDFPLISKFYSEPFGP